jgi:hypothetical protein
MAKLQKFPVLTERAKARWTTIIGDTFKAAAPLLSAGVTLADRHFDALRTWVIHLLRLLQQS